MKIDTTFLHSKVAQRFFILFIFCALIPITILAILSFNHVTKQINKQSQRRLHQASKSMGMAIFERLTFIETEMKMIASNFRIVNGYTINSSDEEFDERLKKRFNGLYLVTDGGGSTRSLFGSIENRLNLTEAEWQHINIGNTIVSTPYIQDKSSRIFMGMGIKLQDSKQEILLGEINNEYLWGIDEGKTLPLNTELCIIGTENNILFCSLEGPVPGHLILDMASSTSEHFEWKHNGKEYIASYWTLFLKASFFVPNWTVVLSESKANMLAPVTNFSKAFLLVLLLSLLVVLFLSINMIRRNLVPLERLKEGTQRVGMGDFRSRVKVSSGDEFEDLAESFNTMLDRLGRHFNTLTTIAEVDRTILSTLDTEKIVNTVLSHMSDIFPCDCIGVTLLDTKSADTAYINIRDGNPGSEKMKEVIQITPEDLEKLSDKPDSLLIDSGDAFPQYIAPLVKRGLKSFLILPFFIKEKISGFITLAYLNPFIHNEEDLLQARQLVNQVAVALSNSGLLEELNQLNWGTLTALARTVDAKSPWTAGHSERVTNLALNIGRFLRLPQKELDDLHRGGLLHDIGKIGIPHTILNKPGKLTKEEFQIIRGHPNIGARILEPIKAYAEAIPIVLQHHEWFNGNGYPDGLTAEAISLNARILAVADFFDALASDRPYRAGMKHSRVIMMIEERASTQFDPKVVQAFLWVTAQRRAVES